MTKRTRSLSLIRMYVATIGIAAIIPALSISVAAGLTIRSHIGSEIEASARSVNQAIAQEAARYLENSLAHLHTYAALFDTGTPRAEIHTAIAASTEAHAEITRAYILDVSSRIQFVAPPDDSLVGNDLSGLAVLEALRRDAGTAFSKAFLSPADGSVAVSMAQPASNGEIILMELNLDSLSDFFQPLLIDRLDRIAILDGTGRFIAHTDMAFVREQRYETRLPSDTEAMMTYTEAGVIWYAHSQDVPGTPWRVVYYSNATEAFSVLPGMLRLIALVTLLCLGIAAVVGVRLWSLATTEFSTYVQQVGAVADGRYDLKVPSKFQELSALSTSIETMAAAVSNREGELRATVAERESLLKEVHHRVKNNLQIVVSLLNLEMNTLKNPETASAFIISMDRIRSMGLIHETLYGQKRLDSIELDEYARRLIGELAAAYGTQGVGIRKGLERVVISLDQAVPCGLILNELMTNAFKYGAAGRPGAEIEVRLGASGDSVELTVTDDGPGLRPGFDPASSAGLGFQLIHSLAAQLGGEVGFEPRQGGAGLCARLRFPLSPVADVS